MRLIKDLQIRFKGRRELKIEGGVPSWWWALEEDDEEDDGEVREEEDGIGPTTPKSH